MTVTVLFFISFFAAAPPSARTAEVRQHQNPSEVRRQEQSPFQSLPQYQEAARQISTVPASVSVPNRPDSSRGPADYYPAPQNPMVTGTVNFSQPDVNGQSIIRFPYNPELDRPVETRRPTENTVLQERAGFPADPNAASAMDTNGNPMIAGDPFQYQLPEGNVGFIPANITSLPQGIQVIGILILKNGKSIAAIRFPKMTNQREGDVYYVSEGDDIEIPFTKMNAQIRRPGVTGATEVPEIIFLKVQKITAQHVEVSSQSNLADRHILR
jgi:hypothetical protein